MNCSSRSCGSTEPIKSAVHMANTSSADTYICQTASSKRRSPHPITSCRQLLSTVRQERKLRWKTYRRVKLNLSRPVFPETGMISTTFPIPLLLRSLSSFLLLWESQHELKKKSSTHYAWVENVDVDEMFDKQLMCTHWPREIERMSELRNASYTASFPYL